MNNNPEAELTEFRDKHPFSNIIKKATKNQPYSKNITEN